MLLASDYIFLFPSLFVSHCDRFFFSMPKFLINGIAESTNIIVDVPKLQAGY